MGGRRWVCLAQQNEQTRIDKGPGSAFLIWIELLISSNRVYLSALGVLQLLSRGIVNLACPLPSPPAGQEAELRHFSI
jgi:hypothetical protein